MTWPNDWPTLSGPVESAKLRVLSLGAGVQSTTLALAAARGDVGPMPDCAIFADTGWEPAHVMEHLARLERRLPFPIIRVQAGDLRQASVTGQEVRSGAHASVPWFIRRADGSIGMGKRQCTANYKIEPIIKEIRRQLGVEPRKRIAPGSVEQWIGISTDEVVRMKPARQRFITNRWPLIEAGMSRRDCIRWMEERQEKAAKSACLGCPFQSNAMWRDQRDNRPEEWAQTCEADRMIRHHGSTFKGEQFMHRSCLPLDQAPIDEPEDRNLHLGFDMECEGMCGV